MLGIGLIYYYHYYYVSGAFQDSGCREVKLKYPITFKECVCFAGWLLSVHHVTPLFLCLSVLSFAVMRLFYYSFPLCFVLVSIANRSGFKWPQKKNDKKTKKIIINIH